MFCLISFYFFFFANLSIKISTTLSISSVYVNIGFYRNKLLMRLMTKYWYVSLIDKMAFLRFKFKFSLHNNETGRIQWIIWQCVLTRFRRFFFFSFFFLFFSFISYFFASYSGELVSAHTVFYDRSVVTLSPSYLYLSKNLCFIDFCFASCSRESGEVNWMRIFIYIFLTSSHSVSSFFD